MVSAGAAVVSAVVSLVHIFLASSDPRPSVLLTQLCWTPHDLATFTSSLFQSRAILVRHVNSLDDINENDAHHVVILLNLKCRGIEATLSRSIGKLNGEYRWLLFDANLERTQENVLSIFGDKPIFQQSEIYYPSDFDTAADGGDSFQLKRVYRNSLNTPLIEENILVANLATGSFNWTCEHRSVSIARIQTPGLSSTVINASLVITHNDSLNHLTDYVDKHLDTITKVNYLLTNDMMVFLNATVQYSIVGSWGYLNNETGRWDGMIGELVRGEAQIGASPLFFTADRVETIQYLSMTSATKSKFVFQAPKLSYSENVFLLPFGADVWLSIGGLVFVVIFCLKMVTIADVKFMQYRNMINETQMDVGWVRLDEICTIVLGATCQQGFNEVPFSVASCMVVMILFFSMYSLFISYSATIVALLQTPSSKIRTLNDLLNSRLKFGVDDTVFNRYYFSHQTEAVRRAIYEQKVLNRDGSMMLYPLEQGVNKIREGLFAFHMELGAGYKFVSETFFEHEKCTLKEMQFYELIDPWYAIQKNSSLKEMVKVALFRLREHGIQYRENDHLYTKKPVCQGVGGAFITVGLIDVKPALLVILWGFLFSFLALLLECFCHKHLTSCCKRKKKGSPK